MFFKKIINAVFLLVNQIEEGNGNPLQSSCLENPIDRGAWQAAVHGVAGVGHVLATKPPPPISQVGQTHQGFVALKNLWDDMWASILASLAKIGGIKTNLTFIFC